MDDECEKELGRPISSLKVTELRDELTKRALTKTGNKKELIDRLRGAIQRQSSGPGANQQVASADQLNLQSQHLQTQNVPQFMNAVALQQQSQAAASVAAVYQHQLNQIQPQQAQLSTYAVAMNQPHYQGSPMQPLDLQQQTSATDYQTPVQYVTADYQQQQQHNPQQYQAQLEVAHPPIDMRVTQAPQQQTASPEEQTIDLSSSSLKRQNQEQPSATIDSSTGLITSDESAKEQRHLADDHEKETANINDREEPNESQENLTINQEKANVDDEVQVTSDKISDHHEEMVEKGADESATGAAAEKVSTLDQPIVQSSSEKNDSRSAEIADKLESSMEEVKNQQSQPINQFSTSGLRKSDDTENQSQSSISLKRCLSDNRDSSSSSAAKEKKRRWQSKEKLDTAKDSDASQLPLISGGISSQKLQELIDVQKDERKMPQENSKDGTTVTSDEKSIATESRPDDLEVRLKTDPVKSTHEVKSIQDQDEENNEVEAKEAFEESVKQELEPTNSLLVENLVRPFTIMQLKEVLTKHGPMIEDKFWTDKVKSKCCVVYESMEVAKATKESLNGQQWPSSNPKTLKVTYIKEEAILKYQSSELTKPSEVETNGGNISTKSITDRLGEKLEDGAGISNDTIKKRLGERAGGDLGTKSSNINRDVDGDDPKLQLDDLFKRTKAVPNLFWLPLTDELADMRQKEREEREARNEEAVPKPRRSPSGHRSPIRNRSPIARRSPPRYRSPKRQRSPLRHRSPPRYRSRSPINRRRFPVRQRSPLLRRNSPRRLSPRRSPPRRSPPRRSPLPLRRSPVRRLSPRRISPVNRVSPPLRRRSPANIRRSPMHRSPLHIRRSPAPIRGPSPVRRSPVRKRSPLRRRSPMRHISPERSMDYVSEQRRLQRLDRLR